MYIHICLYYTYMRVDERCENFLSKYIISNKQTVMSINFVLLSLNKWIILRVANMLYVPRGVFKSLFLPAACTSYDDTCLIL